MKIQHTILCIFCFSGLVYPVMSAPKKSPKTIDYIEKHSDLAVRHMKKYKIPASIILSQGILESGVGMSECARLHKNHFGIKANTSWKGKKQKMLTSEYRNGKLLREYHWFRVYDKVEDSYEDHSLFLLQPRYSKLFLLDITDYKGWAKGLQVCGYATDIAYANKLIKVIEDYELYGFDTKKIKNKPRIKISRNIYKSHNLVYVLAEANDNLNQIADDLGFGVKKLVKYNEVPEGYPLRKGDIVYLEKKKKKADKPYFEHIVQVGESMHQISQQYGMQVKRLYKLNKQSFDYVPVEGDVLRLR
ncbi:MAG: Autolysin [Candidatus Ordinivivax streblomastigis]|uniref:Peptidoglycan hydrolase n=1 Tax=Candidatus Ordinivivax streblomastigis TaxID=2540710 RepID=A0A5M8NYN5_9BACT|nr:MAG: Autolysin [Candidatus Ordinivivax streblomastigis]